MSLNFGAMVAARGVNAQSFSGGTSTSALICEASRELELVPRLPATCCRAFHLPHAVFRQTGAEREENHVHGKQRIDVYCREIFSTPYVMCWFTKCSLTRTRRNVAEHEPQCFVTIVNEKLSSRTPVRSLHCLH